jgi:outer membrane protein assembly factor BamA
MRLVKLRNAVGCWLYVPLWYPLMVLIGGVLMSCDATRSLADKELLYTGSKVIVTGDELGKEERKVLTVFSEELIRPRPNTSVLGVPYKLIVHEALGRSEVSGSEGWFAKLKSRIRTRYGEAPVLYSRVDPSFTSRLIQNELDNKGYFRAHVAYDTLQYGKKVKVVYKVLPGKVYRIGHVEFPDGDNIMEQTIKDLQPASLLKSEMPYSLDLVKAERLRIDGLLKEQGFFYFSPDHLLVQADSTAGDSRVNLKLVVKPETPALAYEKYYIRNILIDPPQDFRKGVLENMLQFQRNSLYNRTNHNLALHRLVSMGNFQFVRNRFVKADTTANYLDAIYMLTPLRSKSLQAEVSARTNSAGFSGSALSVNRSHRNTFRGGELFNVSMAGSMDFQFGEGTDYNLYRSGAEVSLVWPRLVAPFRAAPSGRYIPKTRAALGYEWQHRSQLYTKHQFSASFGYQWKTNPRTEHRLMLTDVVYANPAYVSDRYKVLMQADPGLIKSVERELMLGPSYTFEYTNTMEQQRASRFYVKSSVQTSAVLTGLITGVSSKQSVPRTVLGVPFSQFVRLEQEYRHYFRLNQSLELAGRALAGAGFAYGNSVSLPYARQFFTGGSGSLRAFAARSVGPGTFRSPVAGSGFLPDESGDLKLELNAELRAKLVGFLHGALFVDAGNVWLLNESSLKPGGAISATFLNELAIGTGAGLRLDFSMLVLRFDLAIPVHKPWLPAGNRWVGSEADFATSTWWKNNRMWNIAIGYPF